MEYRSDYFDDPDATASFERATREIFRLDFTRWKDRGLWNAGYRPFSAFVEGVCVASLCVYPSQMRVGGRPKQGAQLLTVGTLPEYRSRGIQRELWARAHAWIRRECDFAFLFTDDEAAGLYTGLGLRRQPEFSESVSCPRSARWAEPRFKLLDLAKDADFATIERLAHARGMVSDRLGFFNPNLLLFMFLYFYQSWSYYLEDIDAVIVAEKTADRLRIHDIVATEMPRLSDIGSFLAHFNKAEVEFLFCTDRLDTGPVKKRPVEDSVLFVSDDFDLEGEYVFPSPFARNCRERALIAGAPASRRLLLLGARSYCWERRRPAGSYCTRAAGTHRFPERMEGLFFTASQADASLMAARVYQGIRIRLDVSQGLEPLAQLGVELRLGRLQPVVRVAETAHPGLQTAGGA